MAARKLPEDEKFLVAFSFSGEQRDLVRSIAEAVEKKLGPSTVFLDEWYEYYIAGNDGDLKLQNIYSESHRVLRRLQFLREWSHEQEQQVFPRST